MCERRQAGAEHARLVENLECVLVAGDVQLVARTSFEGTARIRSDLAADAERPEQAEGPPRHRRVADVEVNGHFTSTAEVNASGGMEEAGELGEPITFAARCDRGELVSQVLRE